MHLLRVHRMGRAEREIRLNYYGIEGFHKDKIV